MCYLYIITSSTVSMVCEATWDLVVKTLTPLIASLGVWALPASPQLCLSLSLPVSPSLCLSLFLPASSPPPSLWEQEPPGGSGDPSLAQVCGSLLVGRAQAGVGAEPRPLGRARTGGSQARRALVRGRWHPLNRGKAFPNSTRQASPVGRSGR